MIEAVGNDHLSSQAFGDGRYAPTERPSTESSALFLALAR